MTQGLLLEHVAFAYKATTILDDIHLAIPSGQFVTLLGASGCGKSTLLRLIAGLQAPSRGRLFWNGQPIVGASLERGIVFQDYTLFPWLSVADNITIAIGKARPDSSRSERRDEARHTLRQVGLEAAIDKYPFELSGGMLQRGAIARALALKSPLLLLDEPFGALDPVNRARLQDLLLDIWETSTPRKTIVFVTHDIDEALYLSKRCVILGAAPGRVLADLEVPFTHHPSHREDRQSLYHAPEFQALRESVAEMLANDILRRLIAA